MLTVTGAPRTFCDGVTRRGFLRIGATGIGGLMLSDLLRLEAQAGGGSSRKALINIHLSGGPSHLDLWDLKPEAPSEIRGEFSPIPTRVPGLRICELLPRLAKMAHRFALVRGMVGSYDDHGYSPAMTGFPPDSLKGVGGRPPIGSVISKLTPPTGPWSLPYVSLLRYYRQPTPGFLGPIHQPFIPDLGAASNLTLGRIDARRLKSRTELLGELDTLRRDVDASGRMEAIDSFTRRALDMVTSGKMAEALDLGREKPEIVKRYGASGNTNFLLARRLIEAGVRCVAMDSGGDWDTHITNFKVLRDKLPPLDLGLSALLDDLDERGMLQDVVIVVWGEFGRTPRINDRGGRDHWPAVSSAFLAGGGLRTGQVVGSSDRHAGQAVDPVHLQQVHATLYHQLGIEARSTVFTDPAGRPHVVLDHPEPVKELI